MAAEATAVRVTDGPSTRCGDGRGAAQGAEGVAETVGRECSTAAGGIAPGWSTPLVTGGGAGSWRLAEAPL
ncbi:protein of unknown function [Streptomyces sp. KY70]|nr:protein of unknown function [Streptomyces sp. KY70]